MLLTFWSPKGGSGTSVVAAAVALTLARRAETRLVDLAGDQAALLGVPPGLQRGVSDWLVAAPETPSELLDAFGLRAASGLTLLPSGRRRSGVLPEAGAALVIALRDRSDTVIDAGIPVPGSAALAAVEVSDISLLVIRGCYLALRRALACDLTGRADGVVVVDEPGRTLDTDDIGELLHRPVVARFPVRSSIARAVDAGVLACGLPAPLARPAEQLVDQVVRCHAGRAA
jgi:cellulose biosynthesis protein BcsQ